MGRRSKNNTMWSGVVDGWEAKRIWQFAIASEGGSTESACQALGVPMTAPSWHSIDMTATNLAVTINCVCYENAIPTDSANIAVSSANVQNVAMTQQLVMGDANGTVAIGTFKNTSELVYTTIMYPNLSLYDEVTITTSITGISMTGANTVQAVGSYSETGQTYAAGYLFTGTITSDNQITSETYETLPTPPSTLVPENGYYTNYYDNYPQSVSGNVVVGIWSTETQAYTGVTLVGCAYNIPTRVYTYMMYPGAITTNPYGVWNNGDGTYTICGSFSPTLVTTYSTAPIGNAFIVDFNPTTGVFINWTYFVSTGNLYGFSSICGVPNNANQYVVGAVTTTNSSGVTTSSVVTLVRDVNNEIFNVSSTKFLTQSGFSVKGVTLSSAVGSINGTTPAAFVYY